MNTGFAASLLAGLAGVALASQAAAPDDPALRVRNPSLEVQWTSPDLRPAPFDKVMLAPVELAFRPVEPLAGPPGAPSTRGEFPVEERDRRDLADDVNRIFREEIGRSRLFTLTDQPGPGVLVLKPELRDIVSRMPPEEPPGRSAVLLDTVGEATLVVSFVDSTDGRVIGTATDRRVAEPAGGRGDFGAVPGNRVGATQEVRRVVRRWGSSLEKRVEQLYLAARPR